MRKDNTVNNDDDTISVMPISVPYNRSHNFKTNTETLCERYGVAVDVLEVGVTSWLFWQTRDFKIVMRGNKKVIHTLQDLI